MINMALLPDSDACKVTNIRRTADVTPPANIILIPTYHGKSGVRSVTT